MKLHNKDTGEDGRLMMCHDYDEYPFFIEIGSIKIYYHNFADMIEAGWDCVKIPAEPLIKDEKIRKAVRAWAEACGVNRVVNGEYDNELCAKGQQFYGAKIVLTKTVALPRGRNYTITELCGEEEE